MTACREFVLADVLFRNEDGLLTVELFRNGEQLRLLFLLLLRLDKGHVLTPAAVVSFLFVLTMNLVKVLVAKQDGLLAQREEELVATLVVMVECQSVDDGSCGFNSLFPQPTVEKFLALFLCFAIITTQNGLNL